MQGTELKGATFKYIESELYAYPDYQREIRQIRDEIIHGQGEVDENIGAGKNSYRSPGQPTEIRATKLEANKRLRRLEEISNAIERVYEQLDDTQKNLVHLRYWSKRGANWEYVADECFVSRRTAFNYRREIVYAIAHLLGEN
ncbi:DUF722 domain-containing protein [Salicibibacter cibarius]|uniref:DUF722 domain-containing protein n=1 Tax=Salicibibacter cibarius TaxID=2743000 RepID=A0A7T7CAU3_9BACI|nr:DUF722 domain-containing protein [Salicibibacter cibarius]QQK75079.1 DUF722 domain-containing protein [Salicibibacter cibarius]QQK75140.1 DUF722 domain-containing protein [Salicibibacter cibarius]